MGWGRGGGGGERVCREPAVTGRAARLGRRGDVGCRGVPRVPQRSDGVAAAFPRPTDSDVPCPRLELADPLTRQPAGRPVGGREGLLSGYHSEFAGAPPPGAAPSSTAGRGALCVLCRLLSSVTVRLERVAHAGGGWVLQSSSSTMKEWWWVKFKCMILMHM